MLYFIYDDLHIKSEGIKNKLGDFMSFTFKIKDKVEEREIDGDLTIKDLLDDLDLSSETMVSKKNGEIVIEEATIEEGDEIEFIQIIYGG